MNEIDSESRRRELLLQTRKRSGNSFSLPAVHPRYQAAYRSLYQSEDESHPSEKEGSFFLRLVLSIFLFLCFIYLEQNGSDSIPVTSSAIVSYIQSTASGSEISDQFKTVWKELQPAPETDN